MKDDEPDVYSEAMFRLPNGEIVPLKSVIPAEAFKAPKLVRRYKIYGCCDGFHRGYKSYQSFMRHEKKRLREFGVIK